MPSCSRWTGTFVVLLVVPLLYILALGPACWIAERMGSETRWISVIYRPVFRLVNRSRKGVEYVKSYVQFGASPGSEADFRDDQLSWSSWDITFESGTVR